METLVWWTVSSAPGYLGEALGFPLQEECKRGTHCLLPTTPSASPLPGTDGAPHLCRRGGKALGLRQEAHDEFRTAVSAKRRMDVPSGDTSGSHSPGAMLVSTQVSISVSTERPLCGQGWTQGQHRRGGDRDGRGGSVHSRDTLLRPPRHQQPANGQQNTYAQPPPWDKDTVTENLLKPGWECLDHFKS